MIWEFIFHFLIRFYTICGDRLVVSSESVVKVEKLRWIVLLVL